MTAVGQRPAVPARSSVGALLGRVTRVAPLMVTVTGREYGPLIGAGTAFQVDDCVALLPVEGDDADRYIAVSLEQAPGAPPSSGDTNVFVQSSDPGLTSPGIWVQTGMGAGGADMTIWVETGS